MESYENPITIIDIIACVVSAQTIFSSITKYVTIGVCHSGAGNMQLDGFIDAVIKKPIAEQLKCEIIDNVIRFLIRSAGTESIIRAIGTYLNYFRYCFT